MIDVKACAECGVPEYITREQLWLDNGEIVQARDQGHRIVFIESENLDPIFHNIESIIGVPIEPIVITAVRRSIREYMSLMIPDEVKKMIHSKELDMKPVILANIDIGMMVGHGHHEYMGHRHEGDDQDFYLVKVTEPFSIPLQCGVVLGTYEAITEVEDGIKYEKLSEDAIMITTFPSPHPPELKKRLWMRRYTRRTGNRNLERCATCGGPRALSDYQWHLDRGVIVSRTNGRRMVFSGPQELDVIFRELQEEFGDSIPRVVVEAQRLFTVGGFYSIREVQSVDDFGDQLALRGLGNLRELRMSKRGLSMRLDNAVLHLIIVGLVQGVFETAVGVDSSVEWELSEEGNLSLEVTPAG